MKKTKRFLALILALILATSGILSGIPGGGIAQAEEWDIGSEIIGDGTAGDFTGEVMPWAAGEDDAPNSAIPKNELEEDISETPTNTSFGNYSPVSVAEQNFDTENSDEDSFVKEEYDGEYSSRRGIASLDDEVNMEIIEEEAEETTPELTAGDTHTYIYFKKAKNMSNDPNDGGWAQTPNYYINAWGGDNGEEVFTQLLYQDAESQANSYYIYKADIRSCKKFQITTSSTAGGMSGANFSNTVPDSGPTFSNNGVYRLDGYPTYIDGHIKIWYDGIHSWVPTPPPVPAAVSVTKIETPGTTVIYYDASLSAISENKSTYTIPLMTYSKDNETNLVSETPGDVYLVIDNKYYLGEPVDQTTLQTLRGAKASTSQGSYLYKFLVDTSKISDISRGDKKDTFYFAAGKTEGGVNKAYQGPSRTDDIKLADLNPATTSASTAYGGSQWPLLRP